MRSFKNAPMCPRDTFGIPPVTPQCSSPSVGGPIGDISFPPVPPHPQCHWGEWGGVAGNHQNPQWPPSATGSLGRFPMTIYNDNKVTFHTLRIFPFQYAQHFFVDQSGDDTVK